MVQRPIAAILSWSQWRRQHQAVAKACHYRRCPQVIDDGSDEVQERVIRQAYPTDLTDSLWMQIAALLPPAKPRGRPAEHAGRDLVNAYCYVLRTGSGWRRLPPEFPPWQTVHWHVTQWRRAGILTRLWNMLDNVSVKQDRNCIND
jgi:transposase